MIIENVHLSTLLQLFSLNALINSPTCYQSHIPTCIDHILTNQKSLFKCFKTFETGLSDQHKLISTTIKSGSFKDLPKKKTHRGYKNFGITNFSNALRGNLQKVNDNTSKSFESIFLDALNISAPLKTKMLRFNGSAFMTKKLRKEIMKRSKLKNNFNKNRNHESWCKFKTQRNYCVNLLRKSKTQYFSYINFSDVTNNKSFCKFVKPYFNNKGSSSNKITLVENDAIIASDRVRQ